jgi:N-acetylmuramoyl-L-alanine amidase
MKTVVIDPGHGGIDPGAVANGLLEKDVALDVSLKVADLLAKRDDIMSLVTHEGKIGAGQELGLFARCVYANRQAADVFVSIHGNAAGNFAAWGHETFHYPGSIHGSRLARSLFSAIRHNMTEIQPRSVKEANFQVLRDTAMPAALVELGFLTHEGDADFLRKEPFRAKYAAAIASGILDFLGLD